MDYPPSRLGVLVTDTPENGAERYLRDAKKTGMIEKDLQAGGYAVMLFAGGVPVSAFFKKDGNTRSLSFSEFSAMSNDDCKVRIIDMPDLAGRLAQLALESRQGSQSAIRNADDWRNHSERWKRDGWSGLIEIKSADLYGMTLVWRGGLQNDDTFFRLPAELSPMRRGLNLSGAFRGKSPPMPWMNRTRLISAPYSGMRS